MNEQTFTKPLPLQIYYRPCCDLFVHVLVRNPLSHFCRFCYCEGRQLDWHMFPDYSQSFTFFLGIFTRLICHQQYRDLFSLPGIAASGTFWRFFMRMQNRLSHSHGQIYQGSLLRLTLKLLLTRAKMVLLVTLCTSCKIADAQICTCANAYQPLGGYPILNTKRFMPKKNWITWLSCFE